MATACKYCRKDFKGRNRTGRKSSVSPFCSKECYWNSMTILLTCKTCGIKFKRISNGIPKYCSRKCWKNDKELHNYLSGLKKGKEAWNKNKPNTWSKGEKSNFWKGGISELYKNERYLIMKTLEYKIWRRSIFERDNYTCQICEKRGSGDIQANHIKKFVDYPELRMEVNNGITICDSCAYKLVNGHESEWESYFNFNLESRGIVKDTFITQKERFRA